MKIYGIYLTQMEIIREADLRPAIRVRYDRLDSEGHTIEFYDEDTLLFVDELEGEVLKRYEKLIQHLDGPVTSLLFQIEQGIFTKDVLPKRKREGQIGKAKREVNVSRIGVDRSDLYRGENWVGIASTYDRFTETEKLRMKGALYVEVGLDKSYVRLDKRTLEKPRPAFLNLVHRTLSRYLEEGERFCLALEGLV